MRFICNSGRIVVNRIVEIVFVWILQNCEDALRNLIVLKDREGLILIKSSENNCFLKFLHDFTSPGGRLGSEMSERG